MMYQIPDRPGFSRGVEFRPGYDLRNADPRKNYGIHNMEIVFFLIGPAGAKAGKQFHPRNLNRTPYHDQAQH